MNDPAYPDALPAQYRLHWYVLERVLGQGGFGITYLARDTNLDQFVAIKEYLPLDVATRRGDGTVRSRTDDQNERYRWGLDRFIQEARTLARFDHPNIVRALSVFEHNNTAYMVMRFEEGENFAARLERRRTLREDEIKAVLLPVLDGLALVHEAGFIHRDIKPENIHIRADGSPVLLDFGSARNALGHARTVTILVAPGYAPFEQYYSSGENQGPWTDIYGLGATCYRAIAGVAPLDAIARSKGVLGSTREVLAPAAAVGAGRYAPQFLLAVDHALAFAEKDRPQSIADWRRELEETAAPSPPPPAPVTTGAGSGIRGPLLWVALGASVAFLGAAVLWLPRGGERDRIAELERKFAERQSRDAQKEAAESERRAASERQARVQAEGKAREEAAAQALAAAAAPSVPPPPTSVDRKPALPRTAAAPRRPATVAAQARPPAVEAEPRAPRRASEPAAAVMPATATSPPPAVAPAPVTPAAAAPPVIAAPVVAPPIAAAAAAVAATPAQPLAAATPRVEARVPANDREAVEYFRQRAYAGDAEAQYRLGERYAAGQGTLQNNNQACIWFGMAARAGYAGAKARQEQVTAKLQDAEVRQCQQHVARTAR